MKKLFLNDNLLFELVEIVKLHKEQLCLQTLARDISNFDHYNHDKYVKEATDLEKQISERLLNILLTFRKDNSL